mmetsp:Transcript_38386/g.59900  ORF Transcript_38386/g.59900 Transcript_38386/m.59900 type:complete len:177 (-) Transcript_38386:378-908(-)
MIFQGPNPNEATDFPSEEEQRQAIKMNKIGRKKVVQGSQESDFGVYQGGIADTKKQGEGMYTWKNGQMYSGQFIEDLQDGIGTEIFPPYDNRDTDANGEVTFPYYEGGFRDGQRHGKGILIFPNGDKYQGEFKYGNFEGLGTLVWASGDYLQCRWRGGMTAAPELNNPSTKSARNT